MRREGVRTYVVRTETLEEDLQGLFAWLCASPVATQTGHLDDYPGKNDTELSGMLGG